MKYSVLLCLVMAAVGLTTASHPIAIDEVHAEIDAYQQQRAATLRTARAGGNNNFLCYDLYIPQVSSIAEAGKAGTQTCVTTALDNRNQSEAKMTDQRQLLDQVVQTVEVSLTACTEQEGVFDYLGCLKSNVPSNQASISSIANSSTSLFYTLSAAFEEIDKEENDCVGTVLAKAKKDTDTVFEKLQDCLIHGMSDVPTAQPQDSS